jgi:catechol 2,3-dioxygenase-like lactoylglutathione lyase family enzyme
MFHVAFKERRGTHMFHTLMATELIVQDLATCKAFYRGIPGLAVRESESTSNSVSFQTDNVYFFLLESKEQTAMTAQVSPLVTSYKHGWENYQ